MKKIFISFCFVFYCVILSIAQTTTSGINGKVTDGVYEIIGATIQAIHEPSGSTYGTVTNTDGRYSLVGLRTGGPYLIKVSYVGYQPSLIKNVMLSLGEPLQLDVRLQESSEQLEEVVVVGSREAAFNSQRTGAAQNFNASRIENTPMVSRSIYDVAQMIPQASRSGSGMSFAGSNNRYNSFSIDGTVNNDVFGLSSSGTNGGQTGTNPISLDAIEEIQVVIAPFDVRQSGFTGAGINAITKSGTNTFKGSVYGYYNNQNFIGSTPGKDVKKREKYGEQSDETYGVTFGGPLVKNKLFFFVNGEMTKKTTPSNYNVDEGSNITRDEADQVVSKLQELTGGYDGGGYGVQNINTESQKVLARIDWNINTDHKFTARFNYAKSKQLSFSNSLNSLRLNDNGFTMNNKTYSVVTELNSRFNNGISNEFRAGYTRVRDFREPGGRPLPYVNIRLDNTRTIQLGTERYSCANALDQDIFTLTDNVNWYLGNHTLTFGTHNEFFDMKNLFIRENYGSYTYDSMEDFLSIGTDAERAPSQFDYSFSREDITGSKNWAPGLRAAQLGFYVQDEWNVADNFRLTYGVRADIPVFFDKPSQNQAFNETALAKEHGIATDQMPETRILWSPRIGFRWNLNDSKTALLRGGVGIFTSRIPFVWVSNCFSNTGVEYSRTRVYGYEKDGSISAEMQSAMDQRGGKFFSIDPNNQYVPNGAMTSEIDVVDKEFKFPQVFRVNLAYEHRFGNGFKGSLEGLYSKTLNNVLSKNLVFEESGKYMNNGGDKRPIYQRAINPATGKAYTNDYTGVVYLTNTHKGYSYNLTAKLEKDFYFGLNVMAAYTYGVSKSVNDGTSSQALSGWQYNENYRGANNPELSYADFHVPHRLIGAISYRKEYAKNFGTSVSLFYNGQSGSPFSLSYSGKDLNGDTYSGNDLLYVPTDVELQQMKFSGTAQEQAQKRDAFASWINANEEVRELKGKYAERNGFIMPFVHQFDFHVAQDFYLNVAGRRHTLQLNFDVLNVGNLFNRNWGTYKVVQSATPSVVGVDANGVPTFDYKAPKSNDLYSTAIATSSRWRAQVGVKYIF